QRDSVLGAYLKAPKTAAGSRRVPVPAFVADALAAHLARYPAPTVVLPWVDATGQIAGEQSVRLLFASPYGNGPWDETTLARAIRAAAGTGRRSLGLPGRVTPHSLRKLYTTVLHDAGVPLKAIDELTGHVSDGLTLGVYAEVTPGARERAREAVEVAWAEAHHGADVAEQVDDGAGDLGT